ncbi:MAG: hypothetical protein WC292_02055 [Clostridia bacterium]
MILLKATAEVYRRYTSAGTFGKSARKTRKVRMEKHGAQKKAQVFLKTCAFGKGCLLSELSPFN